MVCLKGCAAAGDVWLPLPPLATELVTALVTALGVVLAALLETVADEAVDFGAIALVVKL